MLEVCSPGIEAIVTELISSSHIRNTGLSDDNNNSSNITIFTITSNDDRVGWLIDILL